MFKVFCLTLTTFFVLKCMPVSAGEVTIGNRYTFNSKILSEERAYKVYLPRSYDSSAEKKYPVLYLLDGDKMTFHSFSGLVEGLSSSLANNQIPEFIIVAIENVDRVRDFTPTNIDLKYKDNVLAKLKNPGHADKFAQFIETELQVRIDRAFKTSGRNGIVGFSFGGLFALHTMFTKPNLFDDYLVVDATFIWDNNYLNTLLAKYKKESNIMDSNLFIAVADNSYLGEHGKMNTQWAKDFAKTLHESGFDKLNFSYKYLPEETHLTVFMHAWYHGLQALFK